jgi:acetoin utilization protein AcuB
MGHIPTMAAMMTPFPFYVDVSDTLLRARDLMREHEVRHLPVVKNHKLLGLLTDRDLKRALDPDLGLPPKDELFVRDVYRPDPYVIDDHSPLDDVLEHMATHHLGSALVTKHGRLAGIFTSTDACRAYCEHLRRIFPRPVGTEAA